MVRTHYSEKDGWYKIDCEDDEEEFTVWYDELGRKLPAGTHIGWEHEDVAEMVRKKGVYSEFDEYIINRRYNERRELW